MSGLLPGYEQIHGATARGTNYRRTDLPWRVVLHTIEGYSSSHAGFRSLAAGHRNSPHLWVDPRAGKRWKLQTVPLDKAARSLRRASGQPETNHAMALQVEMAGRAAETQGWSNADLDWLGAEMLAPIVEFVRSVGSDINLDYVERTYGAGEGIILASVSSPIRYNQQTWYYDCNWVSTHQRVTGNSHWDAGDLNNGRIIAAAKEALGETPPSPPPPPSGEITVGQAEDIIDHIDVKVLGLMSFMMANQKTGVIYRVTGTTAPWYGVDALGLRVLDLDGAKQFKRMHEITENTPNISAELHAANLEMAGAEFDDDDLAAIADAVSETDAEFINGVAEATAQKLAQMVEFQTGNNKDLLEAVAEALSQAADAL